MKDRSELELTAQMRFGNGGMEVDEEIETDLTDWGLVEEAQERETKIERAAASEFGIDDRAERGSIEAGEQGTLFADVEQDQQTLTGEQASSRCLFADD